MGVGKSPHLGHPMNSHDDHTVANETPMGHIVSGSKPRTPLPNWHPPWVPLFCHDFEGLKCPSKSGKVNV